MDCETIAMNGTPPQAQGSDLRKHKRREVHYPVWIVVEPGRPPHQCMLLNVSQGGAKIEIDEQLEPPAQFTLLLSVRGRSPRSCRVVWRNGKSMGVEFLQPPPPTQRSAPGPSAP